MRCPHKCSDQPSPTDSAMVCSLITGMRKSHHARRKPARCPEREEVRAWLQCETDDVVIIRTHAMLCIMLGTGMRLEEVLCLCPTDVKMMVTGFKQELKKSGVQLFVGKTKTDVYRQGNMKMLTGDSLIRGVTRYLETAGLTDGNKLDAFTAVAPTFRATRRSNKTKKNGTDQGAARTNRWRHTRAQCKTHHKRSHAGKLQSATKTSHPKFNANSTPRLSSMFCNTVKIQWVVGTAHKKIRGMGKQLLPTMPTQLRRRRQQMSDDVHESTFGEK